ncbi:MAG: ABC transporter permease [Oscillospiraceae bacterium]|nr:ABC transporter permease [Oscillospiraceae bacterium]
MSDNMENKNNTAASGETTNQTNQYSLNDDRRVKVLSPGAMVAKRFFRNRIAVVGLCILAFMFIFSFIGGIITPYKEDEKFYRTDILNKEFAGAKENTEFKQLAAEGQSFNNALHARVILNINQGNEKFNYSGTDYVLTKEGTDFYSVATSDGTVIGMEYKDIVSNSRDNSKFSYDFLFNCLKAYTNSEMSFTAGGNSYALSADGSVMQGADEVAFISRYQINAISPDIFLSRAFTEELVTELEKAEQDKSIDKFVFTDADGVEREYILEYKPATLEWIIRQGTPSRVFDSYAFPSKDHWLGTDKNGMDMLTRLMYGGRVSLIIGFIVEAIATILGIIMGGLAGYFGKWVDQLIMRIVDIFYCIPSMPIIIILGAVMDARQTPNALRMVYLMLILGFLGWPGMARLIRGQILSLREQEFMTATEAGGISVSRRIFKHLVPNVIPQIIVSVTMGVGGTIITEASLSFLGLGVRFPFASWGNIISDVNNFNVLTSYWFIWIPAGILLLLTVLAFNLVGDGLRDAFDPKMKR